MRAVGLVAALSVCAACATLPPATLQPVAPMPLVLGLNDGGHTGVPRDVVDRYCGWQRDLVIRAAVLSAAEADVVLASLAPCPQLRALLLVETNDLALVQALSAFIQTGSRPPPWGVELGNELDLAGLTPWQFNDFIAQAWGILRNAGYEGRIVTGGIYTVDDHQPQDFLTYLRPALDSCPDCVVGLHWYGDTSAYWLARVQQLGLPVIVTEFGIPSCTPAQDAAQTIYVREQLQAYARPGNVVAAIEYQRLSAAAPCDSTDASHLAHFGVERPDGSLKPVADLFAHGAR